MFSSAFADVFWSKDPPTRPQLENLSAEELSALLKSSGIPHSGTKDQQINKFLEYSDLKRKLKPYGGNYRALMKDNTAEQLKDMLRSIKQSISPAVKRAMSVRLLAWRIRSNLDGIKYLEQQAELLGYELPQALADFRGRLQADYRQLSDEQEAEMEESMAAKSEKTAEDYVEELKKKKKSGIVYSEEVLLEDTGQTVTVKKDVSAMLREIDQAVEENRKLMDCLGS